jgi:hypothetical protein
MGLETYWGVGPKTRETLEASLGTEAAIDAIERGDLAALVAGGVDRSRGTRILRHAQPGAGMDLLATRDARSVYKTIIDLAAERAVTQRAADRIRTLTPLTDRDAIDDRLAAVERGRETWTGLDEATREALVAAFAVDEEGGDPARVAAETVVAVQETGATGPALDRVAALDADALAAAGTALGALDGDSVLAGADDELDRLRETRAAIDTMSASAATIVEDLQADGVRDATAFRDGLVEHLRTETPVDASRVRDAMAADAGDPTAFVTETLRELRRDLDGAIEDRTETVREGFEADIAAAEDALDEAETAVAQAALELSLGRFADTYDLRQPTFVADGLAVENARNLALLDGGVDVQPITYALGDHDLDAPNGDRVSVLTGANSGGKTTLLETLCQVAILAHMGLPVPADAAAVSLADRIVFHRRHASFNAGVLESTLQSVVPPLVSGERTVMLVDEFEAITEPGRAADLLHGLVKLTVDQGALGTFVTHLADDLEPLPDAARTDGIVADGLTDDLELRVDYQPRFGSVGRSTPEFIVSRLVANASDRAQQAGFRTLAEAVGSEAVQRTLSDVEWQSAEE